MSRISRISESSLTLSLAGEALACRLRRSSRRRTLALRVGETGEVVINAPTRAPESLIHQFVDKHAAWIVQRRAAWVSRQASQTWEEGSELPYLGDTLRLRVFEVAGRARVWRENDASGAATLCCAAPLAQTEQAVRNWYLREARELLAARLCHHAARAGRAVPVMRLSNARTRWGSLSARGVVSLNWRLIKASETEIDYVICHELAHFQHRNHSAAFWQAVGGLFPDWQTVRRRLREQGTQYFLF